MWYGNGMKKEEGVMKDGREVGRWLYYKENGQIAEVLEHE
jgi:antitoxin component YwqK of YwqJK toxin-antitoxin module